MSETIQVLLANLPRYLDALWVTLQLVFISGALGFFLALPVALARCSRRPLLRHGSHAFTIFFRGTPLLIQIFLVYFGSGQFQPWFEAAGLWPLFREPFFCALFALTINTAAYVGEVIAGGIRGIPYGEIEAARAFGLSGRQVARRILFPRALRITLPALNNETVILLKSSSLASTITLVDLMGLTREMVSETFAPFEFFLVAGAIYFCLIQLTTLAFRGLERTWVLPEEARK